jgi:hypothetical protein
MLASRLSALISPPALCTLERFDIGMDITSREELWTEAAPTRKGSAAKAMVEKKYI